MNLNFPVSLQVFCVVSIMSAFISTCMHLSQLNVSSPHTRTSLFILTICSLTRMISIVDATLYLWNVCDSLVFIIVRSILAIYSDTIHPPRPSLLSNSGAIALKSPPIMISLYTFEQLSKGSLNPLLLNIRRYINTIPFRPWRRSL